MEMGTQQMRERSVLLKDEGGDSAEDDLLEGVNGGRGKMGAFSVEEREWERFCS